MTLEILLNVPLPTLCYLDIRSASWTRTTTSLIPISMRKSGVHTNPRQDRRQMTQDCVHEVMKKYWMCIDIFTLVALNFSATQRRRWCDFRGFPFDSLYVSDVELDVFMKFG